MDYRIKDYMSGHAPLLIIAALVIFLACSQGQKDLPPPHTVFKVVKTDEEWQQALTHLQDRILRQKGTEVAFTGEYWDNHKKGTYTVWRVTSSFLTQRRLRLRVLCHVFDDGPPPTGLRYCMNSAALKFEQKK